MKFKFTLIIFIIFVVLLAFVLLFDSKSNQQKEAAEKILSFSQEDIEKIVFEKEEERLVFQKDDSGEWMVSEPFKAEGDKFEINSLASDFSDLKYERIVEENPVDLEKYGIPQKEISFFLKNKTEPLKLLIGIENPLDNTYFAKKQDDMQVVLISSSFKTLLEKKLMDFRKKNIFEFQTNKVKNIEVNTKALAWTATKSDEEWFLEQPVYSLANKSHVDNLLYSLSNLKAQEFVSENKTDNDMKGFGLKKPDFSITLFMPALDAETFISLHKLEDNVYAASSSSTKIIRVEENILDVLNTQLESLRERKVGVFYSWEIIKIQIQRETLDLILTKDDESNWHFGDENGGAVDRAKVDQFIRFFETNEATEFADPPLDLTDFGLQPPQGKITFWIEEGEDQTKEVTILIGERVEDIGQVYVKNDRFDYLFRISSSFMDELPKDPQDWEPEIVEEQE
jgi:hypothetical protein